MQDIYNFLNGKQRILSYADAGDPPPPGGAGDPPPGGAGDPPPGGAGDPPPGGAGDPPPGAVKFTQDDVNRFLAEDRRKSQKNTEKTIAELKKLQEATNISTKQKDELAARITQLQNEHLSKEEQQKRANLEAKEKFQKSLDTVTSERDLWKGRHTSSTIVGALQNAAVQANAFNPDQVVALLQPKTRLVETLNAEGEPSGVLEPRVSVRIKDKDEKEQDVDVPVAEAVKQLVEQPDRYGNLFRDSATGGVGGTTRPGGAGGDKGSTPPTDPAKYREWRKKHELPDK